MARGRDDSTRARDALPRSTPDRRRTDETVRVTGTRKTGATTPPSTNLPEGGTLLARLGEQSLPAPIELRRRGGRPRMSEDAEEVDGRYVVGQELGRGGMGIVRLVRDLDVGREVAMKTLNLSDPDAHHLVQPLIEEAQTTGQLQHPNIIPVYELGVRDSGEVFYTMQAVSGMSLKEVLRKLHQGDPEVLEEYTERRLLSVLSQVCLAMQYAHESGVVHRDLKPDNILLGEYGEVLVMDWGIAYVIGRHSMLARDGVVVGTPHYMAPEQARGEIGHIDGRADIFSLGVMLYQLLTWSTPITTANTELALDECRTMETAPRPDRTHTGRPVPDDLAEACEKAMAPEVSERLPSARMLHDMIENYLEGSAETERRQRMAALELAVGVQAYQHYLDLRRRRERLDAQITRRESRIHKWDPQSAKRSLWDLKTRHQHLDLAVSQGFSAAVNHFHRVLGLVPEQPQARAALAQLFWIRFEEAEAVDDVNDMMYFADQVLKYNDGGVGGPLEAGTGTVTVRSFPEGATVSLFDSRIPDGDDELGTGRDLGEAPVHVELEVGLHFLVARKAGYKDARQAVFVRPSERSTFLMTLKPWAADEPIVGRAGELDLMRLNLDRAMAGRSLRRLLVTGADGMGKTRLLTEFTDFIESHPQDILFLFGECHEAHTLVPWGAVTEALRIRAGITHTDDRSAANDKLAAMIEHAVATGGPPTQADRVRITSVAEILSRLPAMVSSEFSIEDGGEVARQRFDGALVEAFRLMTRWMPGLLYLSQVEYLDDASGELLERLSKEDGELPMLILGFGTDVSVTAGWDDRIHLEPLSASAVDALLRALLKGPLPEGLHEHVMQRSAGVPFLVVDTVRRLAETYDLYSSDGRWFLKDGLVAPGRVDTYQARLEMVEDLPERLARVLQWAAVIGDVFWPEALTACGIKEVDVCCADLAEREFIRTTTNSRYEDAGAYAFRSLLFREIVYDSIEDPDELASMHRAVADWMRDRFDGDIREVAELARHVEQARDEDWAALLWGQLGDACRESGCFGLARECYQRALVNTVLEEDRIALEDRLEAVRAPGKRRS